MRAVSFAPSAVSDWADKHRTEDDLERAYGDGIGRRHSARSAKQAGRGAIQ